MHVQHGPGICNRPRASENGNIFPCLSIYILDCTFDAFYLQIVIPSTDSLSYRDIIYLSNRTYHMSGFATR